MGHLAPEEPLPSMTDIAVSDASVIESTVRLAASGDDVACARLVGDHHDAMLGAAFVIVGDADTAREAVQAAWSIAWRRLPGLRDPERVRPWLVAIAANEARHLVRRQRRRTIVEISAGTDQPVAADPADGISFVDLERALHRLTVEERTLLALRYVAGFDSTQIARYAGLSASGVRSRLARLVDRLRKDLDHE